MIDDLPLEVVWNIFEFLNRRDIISVSGMTKSFRTISQEYLVEVFGLTLNSLLLNQMKLDDLKYNDNHKEILKLISKDFVIYGNNVQALLLDKVNFKFTTFSLKQINRSESESELDPHNNLIQIVQNIKSYRKHILFVYCGTCSIFVRFKPTKKSICAYVFQFFDKELGYKCHINDGIIYYNNIIKKCLNNDSIMLMSEDDWIIENEELIVNSTIKSKKSVSPCLMSYKYGCDIVYEDIVLMHESYYRFRGFNNMQFIDFQTLKYIPNDLLCYFLKEGEENDKYVGHFYVKTKPYRRGKIFFKELIIGLKVTGYYVRSHVIKLTDQSMKSYIEIYNFMAEVFKQHVVPQIPPPYNSKHRFMPLEYLDDNIIGVNELCLIDSNNSLEHEINTTTDFQLAFRLVNYVCPYDHDLKFILWTVLII